MLEDFAHTTDHAYSAKDIQNYERIVLMGLKFKVNYTTLGFMANYISLKWDKFAKHFPSKHSYDLPPNFKIAVLPQFRTNDDFFFRNYFQIIDAITLDIDSLNYSERIISAAIIYLLLGIYLGFFNIQDLVLKFWKDPMYYYSNFEELNIIFQRFVDIYLDCGFDVVIGHVWFVGFFFSMKFDYSKDQPDERDVSFIIVIIVIIVI